MARAILSFLAVLALLAPSACRRAPLDPKNAVTVVSVLPAATTLRKGDFSWHPAKAGDLLGPMDKVQTSVDASVTLALSDDQRFTVQEMSLVVISDYRRDAVKRLTTGVIEVQQGRVLMDSPGSGENAVSMTCKTPNSEVSAERKASSGQGYELVIVTGAGEDKLSVHEGAARVSAQGVSVDVPAGMGSKIARGGAPQPPKPLPPPPTLLTPETQEYSLIEGKTGAGLRWAPSKGMSSYRVAVASDAAFMRLAADLSVDSAAVSIANLGEGEYLWRVGCLDAEGLEGKPSAPRRFKVSRLFGGVGLPQGEGPALAARFRPEEVGKKYFVGGRLRHPDLAGLDVVVYALVDGWYAQWYPYTPQGLQNVIVESDGYFEIATNGGTRFKVYAVRKGYAGMPPFRPAGEPPKPDGKDVLLEAEARALF
jgi:hypothetical protein